MRSPDKRVRIARITINGGFGGIRSLFKALAEGIDTNQFDLHVIYLGNASQAGAELRNQGVRVHELNCTPKEMSRSGVAAIRKLKNLLAELDPDVIHSCTGPSNYIAAVANFMRPPSRRAALVNEEVSVARRKLGSRIKFGIANQLAVRIVAVSGATHHHLVSSHFASPEKIITIHNSYPPTFDQPIQRNRKPNTPLRILMVGRISSEKNHVFMIRVIAKVSRESNAPFEFHIIGDGPNREQLEQLAQALNISEQVVFHGYQSDVRQSLIDGDLYVFPSIEESFGIALVEAMRCGLPVVSSNVGGIPEVMEGYPRGYMHAPSDEAAWVNCILSLIHMTESERNELGAKAKELAMSRFSPDAYTRKLENLYRNVSLSRT